MSTPQDAPVERRAVGWHPSDADPDELYYWDGEAWTQHLVRHRSGWATTPIPPVRSAATPAPRGASTASAQRPFSGSLAVVAIVCSVLVIAGSVGSWLSLGGLTRSGTELSVGYVSLVAGVILLVVTLGVLIARGVVADALLPFVMGAAGVAVAIPIWVLYEAIRHATVGNVGWGLFCVFFAGFGAFVAGAIASTRAR